MAPTSVTVEGLKENLFRSMFPKSRSLCKDLRRPFHSRKTSPSRPRSWSAVYRSLVKHHGDRSLPGLKSLVVNGVIMCRSAGQLPRHEHRLLQRFPWSSSPRLINESNGQKVVISEATTPGGQVRQRGQVLRPRNLYKGKGIRYEGEKIRRKVGKTGVK